MVLLQEILLFCNNVVTCNHINGNINKNWGNSEKCCGLDLHDQFWPTLKNYPFRSELILTSLPTHLACHCVPPSYLVNRKTTSRIHLCSVARLRDHNLAAVKGTMDVKLESWFLSLLIALKHHVLQWTIYLTSKIPFTNTRLAFG